VTLVVALTTLITASHLDEIAPTIARVLAYGSTLLISAWMAWPLLRSPRTALRTFFQA
jgi:hypothetical protein